MAACTDGSTLLGRALSRGRLDLMRWTSPVGYKVIKHVLTKHLTYLDLTALLDLSAAIRRIEKSGVEGVLVETGCALGGSALVMAASKTPVRPLYLYDTFGGLPPPSAVDGPEAQSRYQEIRSGRSKGLGGDEYYGYLGDLVPFVLQNFNDAGLSPEVHHISLMKGLFQEILILDRPVAFAHVDCDWYESVKTCLERIVPHLVRGGTIVIDDYFDWAGCRKAVDDYFGPDQYGFRFVKRSRLHIIKTA